MGHSEQIQSSLLINFYIFEIKMKIRVPDFYSLLKNRVYRRNKINQDSPQNTESECYAVN